MPAGSCLPRVPPDERIYAIGDIHGRADLLARLLPMIAQDASALQPEIKKHLIFLGDYIDRGAQSRQVIDCLLHELPGSFIPTFLRGNHEDAMLRFLSGDFEQGMHWLHFGGQETLASYGLKSPSSLHQTELAKTRAELQKKLPSLHHGFLDNTRYSAMHGDYYFVHAGVRPDVPLEQQSPQDMMWIRREFLSSAQDHGKIIVHGHSIKSSPDVRPNRIGIDTGAYASGHLTCLVLQDAGQQFMAT